MRGFWKRFLTAYASLVLVIVATVGMLKLGSEPEPDAAAAGELAGAQAQLAPQTRTSGKRPPLETVTEQDYDRLTARRLLFPVPGADTQGLIDTFAEARGARRHEALDIMAEAGLPVVAVEDGVIAKLFNSKGGGGLTVYQFDTARQYCYYYAHLSAYAPGLKDGVKVKRGERIGYVGMTGNARTPHLHFAIFKLNQERLWWRGTPLNPYPVLGPDAPRISASTLGQ